MCPYWTRLLLLSYGEVCSCRLPLTLCPHQGRATTSGGWWRVSKRFAFPSLDRKNVRDHWLTALKRGTRTGTLTAAVCANCTFYLMTLWTRHSRRPTASEKLSDSNPPQFLRSSTATRGKKWSTACHCLNIDWFCLNIAFLCGSYLVNWWFGVLRRSCCPGARSSVEWRENDNL